MAYFAQFELDVPCVAMVTASHNDNGWTGVKMGANRPLTFGPEEMTRLKEIVLNARFDLSALEFVVRPDSAGRHAAWRVRFALMSARMARAHAA
jgi:phosphomannomutase